MRTTLTIIGADHGLQAHSRNTLLDVRRNDLGSPGRRNSAITANAVPAR